MTKVTVVEEPAVVVPVAVPVVVPQVVVVEKEKVVVVEKKPRPVEITTTTTEEDYVRTANEFLGAKGRLRISEPPFYLSLPAARPVSTNPTPRPTTN